MSHRNRKMDYRYTMRLGLYTHKQTETIPSRTETYLQSIISLSDESSSISKEIIENNPVSEPFIPI